MTDRSIPGSGSPDALRAQRNRRILAGLGVLFALAVVAVAVFVATKLNDTPDQQFARHAADARAFAAAGKAKAAVIEYKNAIRTRPDDADIRWELGQLYLQLGDAAAAYKEISKAQGLGLRNAEVTRALLQASSRKGDFDGTLAALQRIREEGGGSYGDQPDLLALEGAAQLANGNIEAAEAAYRQALDQSPEDIEALLGIARLSAANDDTASAEAAVDKVLAIDPDNADALAIKGGVLLLRRDNEAALDYARRAIAANPEHIGARTDAARLLLAANRLDEAEEYIASLEQLLPGSPLAIFLRGRLSYQQTRWKQASAAMTEVLLTQPNDLQALLINGHALFMQTKYQAALPNLQAFIERAPTYLPAVKLLAATYVQLDRSNDALALLNPIAENIGDDAEFAVLYGTVLISERRKAEGQEWLDKAAALSPDSASIRTRQALGQFLLGDTAAATAQLEALSAATDTFSAADYLLVATLLDKRDFDAAIRQCQLLMQRKPDSPVLYNLLASAYFGKDDLAASREAFGRALEIDPDFLPALLNLAKISIGENRLDEADRLLGQALAADERNAQVYVVLAKLAQARNDTAAAVDWLEQAATRIPTAVQPRLLLASHYLSIGNVEVALRSAREASELAPQQPATQIMLARAHAAAGDLPAAAATLKELAQRFPDVADVPIYQAELAITARNFDTARGFIARALELAPDNLRALALEARLAAARGDYASGRATAGRIKALPGGAVYGDILLGDIEVSAGYYAAALSAYGAAHAAAPGSTTVAKLSTTHRHADDDAAARALLEDWLARYPNDLLAANALADLNIESGATQAAVDHYESVLKQDPENILALNNLAYLYLDSDKQQAAEHAARAYALAPDVFQVADTYGWILVRQGKIEQGLQLIEEARRLAPGDLDVRYHYAAGLAKNGDYQRALAELSELLASEAEFSERPAAERLMASLNAR